MVNGKVTDKANNTAILPAKKIAVELIKILLVDDSNAIRETLKQRFAAYSDFAIVGSVDNARTILEQIETLNPDIVLMDIEMPGIDGIKATKAITKWQLTLIAKQFARTKVIVLSSHDEEQYVDRVLNAGAKGYLLK